LEAHHRLDTTKAMLDVIPYGMVDPMAVSIIGANIQAILGLNTRVQENRHQPEDAFITTRNQYDASKILKKLSAEQNTSPFQLGVIQGDLCIPIFTYVYGEAQLGGKAAVISLYRLHDLEKELFYERAAKVAIHEVGHVIGLEHCTGIDCLMRFSKQLEQLDRLPMHFCSTCEYEISRCLKQY
jgi:archaemetzincin